MYQFAFEKLEVWNKSRDFTKILYIKTKVFTKNEKFGLNMSNINEEGEHYICRPASPDLYSINTKFIENLIKKIDLLQSDLNLSKEKINEITKIVHSKVI